MKKFTCNECTSARPRDLGKCACPAAAPVLRGWSLVLRDPASSRSEAASVSETPEK